MNNKMATNTYISTTESKKNPHKQTHTKQNKQVEQKQNHRNNILMVARWEGGQRNGRKKWRD